MQKKVALDPVRFQVLACGRRWGKSRLGAALCLQTAIKGGRAWWIAPSYPMSMVGWRLFRRLIRDIPGVRVRVTDKQIMVPGDGEIRVRSADNPDSLRGEGLDFAVLDECAFMKEEAWTHAIRPSLSERRGGALFISTPKGRNWFYRLWMRGDDPQYDDWNNWRFPTSNNPFVDIEEVEAAKGSLPERIFEQEYMARFLEDAGGVFRKVMASATAKPQNGRIQEGDRWHRYVIGVDLAKKVDFTVMIVMDIDTQEMVYMERANKVDLVVQLDRLIELNRRFRPIQNIIEVNFNEMFVEQAQRAGMPVYAFRTTNASKMKMVDDLANAFDRGTIQILNDPVLVNELQAFEMDQKRGYITYAAPDGMHDDTVIALCLAWQGAQTKASPISVGTGMTKRSTWDMGVNAETKSKWKLM